MFTVSALYHFARFEDPASIRPGLLGLCEREGIKGTLLLAHEGINGTVAGTMPALQRLWDFIDNLPGCAGFEHGNDAVSPDLPL